MTDQKTPEFDTNAPDEHSDYPRATAAEKLTGGMRYIDMRGRWPGDVNDGFEEFVRELRRGVPGKEPPSC